MYDEDMSKFVFATDYTCLLYTSEYYPQSSRKQEAQNMIFALQDKLVLKELYSARLYYNLGNYMGNNYLSCVITAQNALKDYPYTDYREDLSILRCV